MSREFTRGAIRRQMANKAATLMLNLVSGSGGSKFRGKTLRIFGSN